MIPKAAMIFAAGFGTRMGELTRETPKPMLEIGGRPMVDHAVGLLRDAGVQRLVANTHYLPDKIEPHLRDLGVATLYEEPILETGGGLRAARGELDCNPVITMNPDAIWQGPNPVQYLAEAWSPDMTALLMLARTDGTRAGDFSLEHGKIQRNGPFIYTGLQIIRTDRLDDIEAQIFSLNLYWDHLLKSGSIHGVVYPGDWTDIGTRGALEVANQEIRS